MPTIENLKKIFSESFDIELDEDLETIAYNQNPAWDSVSHMVLVANIENAFDIMLDTDDILDMSSFAKAIEILVKYDVKFDSYTHCTENINK